jgi:hypothetical protein
MNISSRIARWPALASTIAVTIACVGLSASTAQAQNIEEALTELEVTVEPVGVFFDRERDGRLARAGRDQCDRLFQDNPELVFRFVFNEQVVFNGTNDILDGIYFFAVETDNRPSGFECDFDGRDYCTRIDDLDEVTVDIEDSGDGLFQNEVILRVNYRTLVRELAGELPDDQGIAVFETADDCLLEGEGLDQRYFVRVFLENRNSSPAREELSDAVVHIDAERPPAPSEVTDLTATQSRIYLSWEQPERGDLEDFMAFWSTRDIRGEDIDTLADADDVSSRRVRLDDPDPEGTSFSGHAVIDDGLTDSEQIYAAVAARDDVRNLSQPAYGEDGAEVLPVTDFWEVYRGAGGAETGGCSAAGGSAGAVWPAVFLLGLLGLRRSFWHSTT